MSIKHPCVRLLAMESREEKQRNIEQRMDAYFNDSRELFFVLGQKLFDLDSKLPLPVGKNFFEQCLGVQMRKNEAEEKYKTQSKLLWDYSEKSDELERHKLSEQLSMNAHRKAFWKKRSFCRHIAIFRKRLI